MYGATRRVKAQYFSVGLGGVPEASDEEMRALQ